VRLFGVAAVWEVVRGQLQAVASLAEHYRLRVLLPYLVRREEARFWRERIRQVLPADIQVGAMVETPAAMLDVENWFDVVDFAAVGCNDLMQCLFAAERDQADLRSYLDPYAPVLYRLLQRTAHAARQNLHRIQLCGVLPQLSGVLPILLGLGYRSFSVEAGQVSQLAQIVRAVELGQACLLANKVCCATETRQVLKLLGLPDSEYRVFKAV
jgi:phosphoenolpyruvate-protein kinase (PTS system EI component)